jgi:AraC-like DNA-binding protein
MTEVTRQPDPLGEILHFVRMSGTFYCRTELTEPWALELPHRDSCVSFHVVTAGSCWLEVGGRRQLLQSGDLALVPHRLGHWLFSDPGAPRARVDQLEHEHVSDRYAILRHGGGGTPTTLICGAVRFDHPASRHLVALLPDLIYLKAGGFDQVDWLSTTLRFMAAEARELRPGGETVITRLADILVIQAIRAWIEHGPANGAGWLRAVQDRQIGQAIVLMHRDPERRWTVASLAGEVAMSRSTFSERFTQLVGEPVMHYLARWRMQLALAWFETQETSIADAAVRLGYRSEAAFKRAFRRYTGIPPGAVRRQTQQEYSSLGSH